MSFIKELQWRGMVHDMMPGTEEYLEKEMGLKYSPSKWRREHGTELEREEWCVAQAARARRLRS